MHLLAAKPGEIVDGSEAVDLGQTQGDIVILSSADTDLACLAAAFDRAAGSLGEAPPTLRLANLLFLQHPYSVDRYIEDIVGSAKIVVVRLLGGARYWQYGVEQAAEACAARGVPLAVVPGDDRPDPELVRLSSMAMEAQHRIWRFLMHGGVDNGENLIRYLASLLGRDAAWSEPAPMPPAGFYAPGGAASLEDVRRLWSPGRPIAAFLFYRAHFQSGNLAVADATIEGLRDAGLNPLPIYLTSLKDPLAAETMAAAFAESPPDIILNSLAFAVAKPGAAGIENPISGQDCPVLQVVLSGGSEQGWRDGLAGLSPRDIAMNVALPEVDGRILSRAVSFKAEARFHEATQCPVTFYRPVADRIEFVCDLASRWARLRRSKQADRRVIFVLANYPNRDGRIGNGVGLDVPAGIAKTFAALADAGYDVAGRPESGEALMDVLSAGVTNDFKALDARTTSQTLPLEEYAAFLESLPERVRTQIRERWGPPSDDPFVRNGVFRLPIHRFGNIAVGLQPARGYNIDPASSYHDPDLPPPHSYIAFYAWIRQSFDAHAAAHFGKHGNLEWLPGKSLALSESCFPEAAMGATPHVYPFIVNDPGEGTQAKRRSAAAIVDHLTPPLTRAESYGPLRELESLVDEYYEASGVDPRRMKILAGKILDLSASIGLDRDLGIVGDDGSNAALQKLDNHLCALKELQIRDGLHVFGQAPEGRLLTDLLVALSRLPRPSGSAADVSLIRALAQDLGLSDGFDPLDCEMAGTWNGPRPDALASLIAEAWRTNGDTVERLELLAANLVANGAAAYADFGADFPTASAVLGWIESWLRPTVTCCGESEIDGLLRALDGRYLPPGPSGAPTRGRPETLPTGRNFYSVDTRMVPTTTAWDLGWKSATLLVERYVQEHGDWPYRVALSAWGTANMRTGGDDIAQALALMGVRPEWDSATGRVTGFEILPAGVLDRPRVDVTLRVSGFFRDAFPGLIDLFDSAARAVADLREPEEINPLAARVARDAARLVESGEAGDVARRRAGHRVFGSMPGAYGAGLQALIDERGWETEHDLARAYLAWGGYAYGDGAGGRAEHGLFEARLADIQAVLHNQDNREHDLLDSDDYYQFEGGLAVAVRTLSGASPTIYHNDHSRPERPRIGRLEEEIARIVRARAVNPKWIAGCMRHGYKGAFEMAATVDYLFAFAATARCVGDHHFDAVYDAYLRDDKVRGFLRQANPAALREMADRLHEALERGLWRPKSNAARDDLTELAI